MVVEKGQLLGRVRMEENENIKEVKNFGELDEIGILNNPINNSNVLTAIPQEMLTGLTKNQQDQALQLFEAYKDVFANDNWDLGKAKDVIHQIDSQESPPI